MEVSGLKRFLDAQKSMYHIALNEIKKGKKSTHWMWFIFPQIKGLGQSQMSQSFSIKNLSEATDYMEHPILGKNLIEISEAILKTESKTATEILGTPDDIKLRSSMTLFARTKDANPVFQAVLNKYFDGQMDKKPLDLI